MMNAVTETKADHKSIFAAIAAGQMEMGPALDPRPETSRDVLMGMRDRWEQIIVWGFVVMVAVWIGLGGLGL